MYVATASLTIGKKVLPPGTILPNDPTRNFRSLVDSRRVLDIPDDAVAAIAAHCLDAERGQKGRLLGSDIQPSVVAQPDGENVPLGDLVRAAVERAHLSAMGWNALPQPAREMLIHAEISLWAMGAIPAADAAEGASAPDAGPGDPPDGPHVLFDPAEHGLKYQGKVVGHTIVSGAGEIVARVSKETYADLKKAANKGRTAYAAIVDDEGSGE